MGTESISNDVLQSVNLARVDRQLNMRENESVSHLEFLLRSC